MIECCGKHFENIGSFIYHIGTEHDRKKGKRTVYIDNELWKEFSIAVLKDKGTSRMLSNVIETLIKQYIEKEKKENRNL